MHLGQQQKINTLIAEPQTAATRQRGEANVARREEEGPSVREKGATRVVSRSSVKFGAFQSGAVRVGHFGESIFAFYHVSCFGKGLLSPPEAEPGTAQL